MLKTLLATPTIAVLLFIGTSAYAQNTCGKVCTIDFWETATQVEIEQELQAVNVHARNEWGETPLHLAAQRGTPEGIKALLEAGADGAAQNNDGEIPFDLAKGNEEVKGTDAYWALNDARFK